jgi:thiol:disulfide interchange protein DsbD
MKTAVFSVLTILMAIHLHAANKATAMWIPESTEISPGQPFRTIVRLTVDDGWHTYWKNPGEGGLPLSIKAELPEGWTLGEIQYPSPKRFGTGDLHGFGYGGEISFPVTLTPPPGAKGKAPALGATVSWLTCNDETCVPGKAEITSAAADPATVSAAYAALPKTIPGAKLEMTTTDDSIRLTLVLPMDIDIDIDPSTFEIFPASRNIIDPAAKPVFEKHLTAPRTWIASAPKSEYLSDDAKGIEIVIVSGQVAFRLLTE